LSKIKVKSEVKTSVKTKSTANFHCEWPLAPRFHGIVLGPIYGCGENMTTPFSLSAVANVLKFA